MEQALWRSLRFRASFGASFLAMVVECSHNSYLMQKKCKYGSLVAETLQWFVHLLRKMVRL